MNKNSAMIRKIHLFNNSSKKFRKTLTIKRKNIILKNSFENSNKNDYSSENTSNINLKTAAQSKIVSESSSIRRAQTQYNQKIKKSFFAEEKEKENKILNLKKFIKNKNKNEITQCETDNTLNLNESKNIMKNDKEIDRLAKKLILKLNEEEYYDKNKMFKYFFGNNISFKNGFFNGINLVTNYINDEKKDSQNNKIFKSNKYINNSFDPNYYNKTGFHFNKQLPLYLREKANIKGTEILSPFCKEARDEFLFNKIFNHGRRHIPKRFEFINNKLNIFYAENENQYIKKLQKYNDKLKLRGKKITHEIGPTKDQLKLNRIKTSLSFIKKIFDYSYPNMILSKVRKSGKYSDKRTLTQNNIPPYKRAELLEKKRNDILEKYLKMSINVKNNATFTME